MTLTEQITFHPASVKPSPSPDDPYEVPALIYNQCDGYHHVFARFDRGAEFTGFYDFCGTDPYDEDFFCAWALLPDTMKLHGVFARPPKVSGQRADNGKE